MAAQAMGKALDEAGSLFIGALFVALSAVAHRQVIAIYGGAGDGYVLACWAWPLAFVWADSGVNSA
jgi:hypothetical protein